MPFQIKKKEFRCKEDKKLSKDALTSIYIDMLKTHVFHLGFYIYMVLIAAVLLYCVINFSGAKF